MPNTHIPKSTADKGKAIAHELKHTFGTGTGASFADNRPEALALGSQIQLIRDSAQAQQLGAVQRMTNNSDAPRTTCHKARCLCPSRKREFGIGKLCHV